LKGPRPGPLVDGGQDGLRLPGDRVVAVDQAGGRVLSASGERTLAQATGPASGERAPAEARAAAYASQPTWINEASLQADEHGPGAECCPRCIPRQRQKRFGPAGPGDLRGPQRSTRLLRT
jgi:hypothetical protein